LEIAVVNLQFANASVIVARLSRLMCGKPPAFRDKPFGVSPNFGRGAASPEVGSKDKVESSRKGKAFPHIRRRSRDTILNRLFQWPKTSLWPVSLKNPKAWFFAACAKQALSS